MTAAIRTTDLHKKYGRRMAIESLDLAVERGAVYGLIGPNGAGKTTTLRMLVDVIRPTSGDIAVLGESPREGGARLRRRIGYVPGELRLQGRVRGGSLLAHLAAISGSVERSRIGELADRLGLDLRPPVRKLSKGNRQKLALVQAFMHDPELLILDEPTSGLDPLVQREFLAMVREAADAGQTVLLSSHVLSEIQHAADEVAVLAEGRLVAQGDVASLRAASVRHVRAVVDDADPEDLFSALTGIAGVGQTEVSRASVGHDIEVTATARGEVDALVKALAGFHVVDLSIEEPDLEESVLDLYAREEGDG